MRLIGLAWRSVLNRRYAVGLTVLTIGLSIALVVLVEQLRSEVRQGFYRSVSGTDLIVGARTAPVQLLLYAVFRIGDATNNVSWQSFQEISAVPEVDWAVPIALGDSYRGYRVVGTAAGFFEQFRYADRTSLVFERGRPFEDLYEVVLGWQVARAFGLGPGDELVLAHGAGRVSLQHHDDQPFVVSGVLAPTATPVDQSLYISLAAHRAIHIGWETGMRRPGVDIDPQQIRAMADELAPETITAFMLGLSSRAAAFGLQRRINEYRAEPLTAILPGIALQELWRITGFAEQILRIVAGLVVVAGLLGMLTVMLTMLNERRREMALLRACGARPRQIAFLLLLEAAVISACGIGFGVVLAVSLQWLAAPWLLARFGLFVSVSAPAPGLLAMLAAIFVAAVLIAVVPAVLAYRRTLADGMRVTS